LLIKSEKAYRFLNNYQKRLEHHEGVQALVLSALSRNVINRYAHFTIVFKQAMACAEFIRFYVLIIFCIELQDNFVLDYFFVCK